MYLTPCTRVAGQGGNMHALDYNLFYGSVKRNVQQRVARKAAEMAESLQGAD